MRLEVTIRHNRSYYNHYLCTTNTNINQSKTMKHLLTLAIFCALTGCTTPTLIGTINSISSRNIDSSTKYVLLKRYAGSGTRELAKNQNKNIDGAIDKVLKSTPGGEYLMNVKIYRIGSMYAIEGDVWGKEGVNDIRGFKVGDKVIFKFNYVVSRGEITALIDDKKCYVKFTDKRGNKIEREIFYDELTKE